jgi:hypothetical protein
VAEAAEGSARLAKHRGSNKVELKDAAYWFGMSLHSRRGHWVMKCPVPWLIVSRKALRNHRPGFQCASRRADTSSRRPEEGEECGSWKRQVGQRGKGRRVIWTKWHNWEDEMTTRACSVTILVVCISVSAVTDIPCNYSALPVYVS